MWRKKNKGKDAIFKCPRLSPHHGGSGEADKQKAKTDALHALSKPVCPRILSSTHIRTTRGTSMKTEPPWPYPSPLNQHPEGGTQEPAFYFNMPPHPGTLRTAAYRLNRTDKQPIG